MIVYSGPSRFDNAPIVAIVTGIRRTFRTRDASEALAPGEIQCPASDESGKRTTCDRCNLCNGSRDNDRRRSIAIVTHGANKVNFMTFRRDAIALPSATRPIVRPFVYRSFGG